MLNIKSVLVLFVLWIMSVGISTAATRAYLESDTLVVENSNMIQKWLWNNGDIKFWSVANKNDGSEFKSQSNKSGMFFQDNKFVENIDYTINDVVTNYLEPKYTEVVITNKYEKFEARRVIKIYDNSPAVKIETYLKYDSFIGDTGSGNEVSSDGTEGFNKSMSKGKSALMYMNFPSLHMNLKSINFYDATDVNDNLVEDRTIIPYKWDTKLKGNVLIGEDLETGSFFYIMKEAPNHSSQINYPSFDFKVNNKSLLIPVSGFANKSNPDEWVKGYSMMIGAADSELSAHIELRKAIRASILYSADEHEMVMQNTWGDRGQDGRVGEKFVIEEIKKAAKLGITHFQIDDGWQQGLSQNSAHEGGKLWSDWGVEDWMPHSKRFPNGIEPVLKVAKKYNMPLGLWFHPSDANDYATWEKDADILIGLYKKMGIKYFKIDGVKIPTMKSVINFEKFINKIKRESKGEIFLNLDATAGVRGGYYTYMNYGNVFLENRYSDWGNYYPFHTLRNLWQMSAYFPPELLQVEFLNKWRNEDKYPKGDIYAPKNYSFDYLFAITMAAQPLAWLESANLPDEAYSTSEIINDYKKVQADFHSGVIMPIGDEPSGKSWTGFQSILSDDEGYLLIYRENTEDDKAMVSTLFDGECEIECESILDSGTSGKYSIDRYGKVEISIPERNSCVFMKYKIVKK